MKTEEFYDQERIKGNTVDITSNQNPNYHLEFYQAIFRLMEGFASQQNIREIDEGEIDRVWDQYCDTAREAPEWMFKKHFKAAITELFNGPKEYKQ